MLEILKNRRLGMGIRKGNLGHKVLSIFVVWSFIFSNVCYAMPAVSFAKAKPQMESVQTKPVDTMALQSMLQENKPEAYQKLQEFAAAIASLTNAKYQGDKEKQELFTLWQKNINEAVAKLTGGTEAVIEMPKLAEFMKTIGSQMELFPVGNIVNVVVKNPKTKEPMLAFVVNQEAKETEKVKVTDNGDEIKQILAQKAPDVKKPGIGSTEGVGNKEILVAYSRYEQGDIVGAYNSVVDALRAIASSEPVYQPNLQTAREILAKAKESGEIPVTEKEKIGQAIGVIDKFIGQPDHSALNAQLAAVELPNKAEEVQLAKAPQAEGIQPTEDTSKKPTEAEITVPRKGEIAMTSGIKEQVEKTGIDVTKESTPTIIAGLETGREQKLGQFIVDITKGLDSVRVDTRWHSQMDVNALTVLLSQADQNTEPIAIDFRDNVLVNWIMDKDGVEKPQLTQQGEGIVNAIRALKRQDVKISIGLANLTARQEIFNDFLKNVGIAGKVSVAEIRSADQIAQTSGVKIQNTVIVLMENELQVLTQKNEEAKYIGVKEATGAEELASGISVFIAAVNIVMNQPESDNFMKQLSPQARQMLEAQRGQGKNVFIVSPMKVDRVTRDAFMEELNKINDILRQA